MASPRTVCADPAGAGARHSAPEANFPGVPPPPAAGNSGAAVLAAAAPVFSFVLPLPPSTNKLWAPVRTTRGAKMVKRGAYADWCALAKREVQAQRGTAAITGDFRVAILLPEGRHDGDNFIKPLLDACQAGGAISNDRHCRGGSWDLDDTREGTALVEIYPIPPMRCAPARTKGNARLETTL